MKRKLSHSEWLQYIEKHKTSGMTIEAFCNEHNFSRHAFRYHRDLEYPLIKKESLPTANKSFQELKIDDHDIKTPTNEDLEIRFKLSIGGWLHCEIKLG